MALNEIETSSNFCGSICQVSSLLHHVIDGIEGVCLRLFGNLFPLNNLYRSLQIKIFFQNKSSVLELKQYVFEH